MKIHIFINCYWGTGMSGGDRRIIELLRRWEYKLQDQIIIYTTKRFHELLQKEGIEKFEVYETDINRAISTNIVIEYYRRTKQCKKILKNTVEDGDIFYSPTDILPDILPPVSFIKGNKSLSWTMITYHIFEKFYKRPGNIIKNFISCYQQKYAMYLGNKYAKHFLTTSPVVVEEMKKQKYAMEKVALVDNAVDTEIIEKSNLELEGYDAVFLARLNYSKGIFELPEIWKKVTDKYPNAQLAIMGKGTDEITTELKNCISENKMNDNITLFGYVEAEDAYSIMKKSKVFLFTSHEEGWGMALAEALVCGIPVVAYDLPVFSYLFKKGISLCELKNTNEMAEKVIEYLENDGFRVKCGQEGRTYILEKYSLDVVSKNELEIIMS